MPALLSLRIAAIRHARDAGVTLMELLVSMALTTILGSMTLMLFLNIDASSSATTDRSISTASARSAIQAWTGYLRVADGTTAGVIANRIEWLTGNDMLFYADINNRSMASLGTTNPPTMMWLRLDSAGQLVEEQFPSTAAAATPPTVCRVLATGVHNGVNAGGSTVALFTAIDVNGYVLSGLGTAPAPAAGCRPLPVTVPSQTPNPDPAVQANLANVRSITIDFQIFDTRGGHPIEFMSQAVLPNLGSPV